MIVLPAGSFLMGSPTNDRHQAAQGTEQPQHRVNIGYAFAVGKFEVTRDEYAEFARQTGLRDPDGCNVHEPPHWPTIMGLNWHNTPFPQTGRDPVVCVSWQEAQAYTPSG
jgi:formylglycine-generating enzyme required for sulfatase activity